MDALKSAFAESPRGLRLGLPILALVIIGFIHWSSAPASGDYWWPDSSRHMLNGIFVRDALLAFPIAQPMAWAERYYDQYPALTIGFYPPGFSVILAVAFLLFGAGHAVAQAVVTVSFLLLTAAVAWIARSISGNVAAFVAATCVLTAPELLLWSRQIQPEIPGLATAALGIALTLSTSPRRLLLRTLFGVALFAGALYFKQTVVVLAPMFLGALYTTYRQLPKADRWIALVAGPLLGAVLLLPLIVLQLRFGGENLRSVSGIPDARAGISELANWTWYAERLSSIAGWPLILATLAGGIALLLSDATSRRKWLMLLVGNALLIYAAFSVVALKEQRHLVPILVPMALSAGIGIARLWNARSLGRAAALALGIWAIVSVGLMTAPRIAGFSEAAHWVVNADAKPCVTLVHAHEDGNFIVTLRLLDLQRECTVIRSDKLLFDVKIRREIGINERPLSVEELKQIFYDLGVRYVVMDPMFWNDLGNTQLLVAYVRTTDFVKRASYPIIVTTPKGAERHRSDVEVYENVGSVSDAPKRIKSRPSIALVTDRLYK